MSSLRVSITCLMTVTGVVLTSGQARADIAPPEASGFSVQASADAVKMDIQTGLFGGGFPGFPADEPPFEGSAAYTEAVYDDLDRWAPRLTRRRIETGHWVPRTEPDTLASWIAEHVEEAVA